MVRCILLLWALLAGMNVGVESFDKTVVRFVADYFRWVKAREVLILTCSDEETKQLSQCFFQYTDVWVYMVGRRQALSAMDSVMRQTYYKYGVFLHYDCPASVEILRKNSDRYFLNSSFHWLVWGPSDVMSSVTSTLNLSLDSEFTWSHYSTDSSTVVLHDIYKINYTWPVITAPAGYWDTRTGIRFTLTGYKYERRGDLQGLVFRAGIALNGIPYTNVEKELVKPENRIKDSMSTFNYVLFQYLMQSFNFSLSLFPTPVSGYVIANGRYEGLVKMIAEGEVDIHVSALDINPGRYRHMDFTGYTWKFRTGCIFRHPPVTGGLLALVQPFTITLWTASVSTWIIVMVVLRFVSWVQFHTEYVHDEDDNDVETSWSDAFLTIMGTVGQQEIQLDSRWVTWRMVFLIMLVVTLLIDTYYASSIVFSLITRPIRTIKTARDLMQSSLRVGAEDISYSVSLFEMNEDPLVQEFYRKKLLAGGSRPHYYSQTEGLEKVLHEAFAFHTELIKIYPAIDRTFPEEEKCSLTEITVLPTEKCYVPIRWNSAYKEIITFGLRRILERGLLNHQSRIWRRRLPKCSLPGSAVVPVGLNTVVPAVGLVVLGVLSSVVILVLERYHQARSITEVTVILKRPENRQYLNKLQKLSTMLVKKEQLGRTHKNFQFFH